jgi:hypothetical protein
MQQIHETEVIMKIIRKVVNWPNDVPWPTNGCAKRRPLAAMLTQIVFHMEHN